MDINHVKKSITHNTHQMVGQYGDDPYKKRAFWILPKEKSDLDPTKNKKSEMEPTNKNSNMDTNHVKKE